LLPSGSVEPSLEDLGPPFQGFVRASSTQALLHSVFRFFVDVPIVFSMSNPSEAGLLREEPDAGLSLDMFMSFDEALVS
jgi:hypothetical protein